MQMTHFREVLVKQSLKYISCSLKRCNTQVCFLNGYKVMPFWHLKGPFRATAISYIFVHKLDANENVCKGDSDTR